MSQLNNLPKSETCVDDIYKLATEGYKSNDPDMMQCVLNEVARLCAEYFQLKEDAR
jgi:hypothetical protein